MNFLLFLHIAAAVFLIGPVMLVTSASPRVIRSGSSGLPVLRWLQRSTRIYGAASIVVLLLGLAMVHGKYSFNEFWISASIALFIVAIGLLFALVERDQRAAIARLEAGEGAPVPAGRIAGVSAAIGVIWLAILLLMIYQPGHHG